MTVRESLRQPDRYGLVLALIVLSLLTSATEGSSALGRVITVWLLGATLLFALRTSMVRPVLMRMAILLVAGAAVLSLAAEVLGASRTASLINTAVSGALVLVTPFVIGRRLVAQPVVTLHIVFGALCIYVLIGMLFAFVYAFTTLVAPGPFFAQQPEASSLDFLYFSFVTLTTVGYGDLTARTGLGRMLAITEALMGQLYLVTVVAILIGNLVQRRRT